MTRAPLFAIVLLLAACREPDMVAPPPDLQQIDYAPELDVDLTHMTRTGSGLYLQDLRTGDGDTAKEGDTVRVLFAGWLPDGTLVEAIRDADRTPPVVLGAGHIIRGWEEGIPGMREGGIRKLVIPPELGFGASGRKPVPPNSVLVFEIELISAQR
jgi:FKBP-type peptidyl-prolyl cis-trans isomerase